MDWLEAIHALKKIVSDLERKSEIDQSQARRARRLIRAMERMARKGSKQAIQTCICKFAELFVLLES